MNHILFLFVHTVYIDYIGNVYIVPMKRDEDGNYYYYYSPKDIIESAMGDERAKQLLENCRTQIKEEITKDLMSDAFMQRLYDTEKEAILNSINRVRFEDDEEPLNIVLPPSPKTAKNFIQAELRAVIASALPIKNND